MKTTTRFGKTQAPPPPHDREIFGPAKKGCQSTIWVQCLVATAPMKQPAWKAALLETSVGFCLTPSVLVAAPTAAFNSSSTKVCLYDAASLEAALLETSVGFCLTPSVLLLHQLPHLTALQPMVVALLLPPNIHGAASLEAALGSENICLSVKPYATFRNSSTHVWIPFWGI